VPKRTVVLPCLLALVPVGGARAEGLRPTYVRAEIGPAVDVLWLEARVGRALGDGPAALDVGVGGSEGVVDVTGGLEVRTDPDADFSLFGRLDLGILAESRGTTHGVVNLGGGVAVRLNRAWSARLGVSRGLALGDGVLGPDRVYVGMEYRW
jgi:hypothetical protein